MLPCHSCYIYGTWRGKEVGEFKVMEGSKGGGQSHKVKGENNFCGGVEPSTILS